MKEKEFVMIVDYPGSSIIENHPNYYNIISFCDIFKKLGYKSKIVVFNDESNITFYRKSSGYPLYVYGTGRVGNRITKYIYGYRSKRCIAKKNNAIGMPDVVIYDGECSPIYDYVQNLRISGTRVLVQRNEWFSLRRIFSNGLSPYRMLLDILRLSLIRYSWYKMIRDKNYFLVNNSMLKEDYERKGCRALFVPNLMNPEISEDEIRIYDSEKLVLGYFGNPGPHNSKDSLKTILEAIATLSLEERKKVSFRVFGINESDLESLYDVRKETIIKLKDTMIIYGSIEKKQVSKEIRKCDFTVLIRNSSKSIDRCMSSKMVESIVNAVPVICNITSDMDKYVIDGESGMICRDESPISLKEEIAKAIRLDKYEKLRFKLTTRKVGRLLFDWRNYIAEFERFIQLQD